MSTITKEFTKEQLIEFATAILDVEKAMEANDLSGREARASAAIAEIALASLEAEAVGEVVLGEFDDCGCHPDARVVCIAADGQADWENFKDGTRLYTAPTVPVSVPDAMEMDDDFDSAFEHGKAVGWNACRAAMLQGADVSLTHEGKNHTEDKLAMVDHSGDSNNMVEPVTTACKLRDAVEIIRNSGIAIDAEKIFAERDALNAPDCWCRTCRPVTFSDSRFVVCPECGNKRCPHANDHRNACTGSNEPGQEGSAYPAAPQQEVESQIRKGKTVAMEEWELGARLTKHRFKP